MENKSHILEYLTLFKRNVKNHNRVTLIGFLYLLVNLLFIVEPNFEIKKKEILISKDISSLQRKISNEKSNDIKLELKKDLKIKIESKSSLTNKIKGAKDLESILIALAFLNAEWKHASLYLTFLIVLFIIYLLTRRLNLLRLLSKFLRESAKKHGSNESKEFGIDSSLLIAPVPRTGFNHLTRTEVIESLGWKHNHNTMSVVIVVILIGVFLIQVRLLFQEYYIAQSVISFHTLAASVLTITTTILYYIWFKGNFLLDSYNSENNTTTFLSRRDFISIIGMSSFFLVLPISYKLVNGVRKKVDRLMACNPRFRIRKGNIHTSRLVKIEEKASVLAKTNQLQKASNYLLIEIKAILTDKNINEEKLQHSFRLIDFLHKILLVRIHRHDSQIAKNMKIELEKLVLKIQPNNFRLSLWNSGDYKWEQVIQNKTNIIKWNKIELK